MNDLRDLYEEVILDHNRNPRNYGPAPAGCNHRARGYNPLCGDECHVHLTLEDGRITDAGFDGVGCAISTASASLMTQAVAGKSEEEARSMFRQLKRLLTEEDVALESPESLGKLAVLMGVREFPMRVKCATLAWHTMLAALEGEDDTVTTE